MQAGRGVHHAGKTRRTAPGRRGRSNAAAKDVETCRPDAAFTTPARPGAQRQGDAAARTRPRRTWRTIPAHAGKPKPSFASRRRRRDYPRTRGETSFSLAPVLRRAGLSPHTRGNLKDYQRASELQNSRPKNRQKPAKATSEKHARKQPGRNRRPEKPENRQTPRRKF